MSDLEFLGKLNPKPFISLAKEEQLRIAKLKEHKRIEQLKQAGKLLKERGPELTYERDVQEGY